MSSDVPSLSFSFTHILLSEIDLHEELLDASDIIHIKGFALRISPNPWLEEIYHIAKTKRIIVFDGDDLNCESFTMQIAALVSMRLQNNEDTLIWAFKYDDAIDEFMNSWNKQIEFNTSSYNDLSQTAIREVNVLSTSNDSNRVVRVFITPIPNFIEEKSNLISTTYFSSLGINALKLTKSERVLAIGGGCCVYDEFFRSSELPHKTIWFYIPIMRRRANEMTHEYECSALENIDVDVETIGIESITNESYLNSLNKMFRIIRNACI